MSADQIMCPQHDAEFNEEDKCPGCEEDKKPMRTEMQKKFLEYVGIDPTTEGELIDRLFTYPKYIKWAHEETKKKEGLKKEMENQETPMPAPQPIGTEVAAVTPAPGIPSKEIVEPAPVAQEAPVAQDGFGKLDTSGEIEKKQFDPTPFIGKDSFIEYIEERKGKFGYYIKLYSQVVEDSSEFEIRASTIYGLDEDANGKIGWPPESKLDVFLKKFKATHYRDLMQGPTTQILKDAKGESFRRISGGFKTQIKIQTRLAKDGKEYLTF